MEVGAITQYIDVAQLVLYAFWAFFAGLIFYLRREDKREGYPLESERSDRIRVQGFPSIPQPKTFRLANGDIVSAPRSEPPQPVANAEPIASWLGAPLEPLGDAMTAGVGPGAWAVRKDEPECDLHGRPKIQPLRAVPEFRLEERDPDPRGMSVRGLDHAVAGYVTDVWVDICEPQVRYYEVQLADAGDAEEAEGAAGETRVLLPSQLSKIDGMRREINVSAVTAAQLRDVPVLANPDRVTKREEDRIVAYYGGGKLYATALRRECQL